MAYDLAPDAPLNVHAGLPVTNWPPLEGLNKEQREAVETLDGPVLVLAGAGTGKTRVLTTRIAYILALHRAAPHQILAVTFTNKAAREMRHRITQLIGPVGEGMPWLGTFHAIGTKILRRHAELVGLESNFTILDTDDQIRLLKQLLKAELIDDKRWSPKALAHLIDGWKNKGLAPSQISAADSAGFANGKGQHFYALYQERLKVLNAVDFGDLLLEPLRLFREHQQVLEQYQRLFKYILVDEYQDTNVVQYLWLKALAQGHLMICCVGDDDQSIYGWRGADVDNILRFEKNFPKAHVVRLERNYRSTGHILNTATHLINHNGARLGKDLYTHDGEMGEKPLLRKVWDSEEEARTVAEEIEQLQHKGHALRDMAILVRASFQMREFEDRFITTGIPYQVIGGPRFYERAEIRDALAYLRCVAQPADDLAFERIVNLPKRGIGEATLQPIHKFARAKMLPLMQATKLMIETEEIKPKPRQTLRRLLMDFVRWRSLLETMPHAEVAEIVLDESGYTQMWQQDQSPEAAGRLENLKELVRSLDEFPDLPSFLEHISLVLDAAQSEDGDRLTIMTLHGAKGLEFETVFLPGWEEGLFPHQKSMDENGLAGLEEERRLAYVGITRARKRLFISYATNRRIHGLWQMTQPSRFIGELPRAHVEVEEIRSGYGDYVQPRYAQQPNYASRYDTPGWQRAQAYKAVAHKGPTIEGVAQASRPVQSPQYEVGMRVFHLKFGGGTIREVEEHKLSISFDHAGYKTVLDHFVSPIHKD